MGFSCLIEGLKIYSSVYLVIQEFDYPGLIFILFFFQITEAGKGKLPNPERVKKLILGILQSTAFLSYNGFGFVWGHCFVR